MSFSGNVKRELCKAPVQKKCCALAECYGVLLYCNSWTGGELRVVTESAAFASRLPQLFRRAFHLEFDQLPSALAVGKLTFLITKRDKLAVIAACYGSEPEETLALQLNFPVVEEECCKVAFLRGAFLAGGSITDPEKDYHLELVTSHFGVSRGIPVLLREMGFAAKEVRRKSNYVTYFKQSELIEDVLTCLGAPLAAMEVMNAKVEKHLRNGVNRRVNCDAANLDKAVAASSEQMEAIRRLVALGRLESLPDKLRDTARLREEFPEYTLSELAAECDPPVTKSCLNHRLRKLMELAKEN